MYAATGGPNVKWGGTDFKRGGRPPLAPSLATGLLINKWTLFSKENHALTVFPFRYCRYYITPSSRWSH